VCTAACSLPPRPHTGWGAHLVGVVRVQLVVQHGAQHPHGHLLAVGLGELAALVHRLQQRAVVQPQRWVLDAARVRHRHPQRLLPGVHTEGA
jgi:hypothetical protein